MINRTRKHIWPGVLVMSIAMVGLLAAFVVLANNPGGAAAHDAADHATDCAGMSDRERAVHDALNPNAPCETDTGDTGDTGGTTPTTPTTETFTLTADPQADAMLPPAPTATADDPNPVDPYAALRALSASTIYVVTPKGEYTAKFHLAVAGSQDDVTVTVTASANEGITIVDSDGLIGAGFKDEDETDLEGSLTVKGTDDGSRAFEIEGVCETEGAWANVVVEDKDLEEVAKGAIFCKLPEEEPVPDDEITASECYSVTAAMAENEVMDEMRDDVGSHPTNPEIGQDTIQILNGSADLQITVTSCEEGPVYIRFLDSDGDVFGTDVDECESCEGSSGADVVGLDSQQKLDLNLGPTEMDAAMALMYDQYNVVTPGDGSAMYLTGKPGQYYQGKFRFMAPCNWEPFEVEVYEKNGKVRQELENGMFSQTVSCVASPKPGPAGLVFEIDSQKAGEGVLTFEPVVNAIGHTVLLIDASNRNIVHTEPNAVSPVEFNKDDNVELNNGWTYHIVVIAEGEDDQYTADAVMDYGVSWLGEADVPLSTDPSATPTRQHNLCKVDDADITALLSDCDVNTAPVAPTATLAAQTVMPGSTVMVQSTIADADLGDTLTWSAMSSAPAMATATVDMGMVTIMGVAAGTATITVTATDTHGAYAMQTIMVTVTAAELGAPTNVMATIDHSDPGSPSVTITWTNGANADGHEVGLVDLSDYSVRDHRVTDGATSHTFTNVASGRYMAIVVSTMDAEFDYDVDIVTVP